MAEFGMGERERGHGTSGGIIGSPTSAVAETPAQRAADAASVAAREVARVEATVEGLEHATNVAAWSTARDDARQAVTDTTKVLERARRVATDAQAATLEAQASRLERAKRRIDGLVAPRAYSEIAHEAEIQAILDAPLAGGAKAGNDKKEQDLAAMFKSFDPAESRSLTQRLNKKAVGDPIATAIGRMTVDFAPIPRTIGLSKR